MQTINKILSILKAVRSPQQAQQLIMQEISNRNPNLAIILSNLQQQGIPANQAMSQMIEAGQLDKNAFYQAKNLFTKYGRFMPFKINESEWNSLENSLNNVLPQNNGFRF